SVRTPARVLPSGCSAALPRAPPLSVVGPDVPQADRSPARYRSLLTFPRWRDCIGRRQATGMRFWRRAEGPAHGLPATKPRRRLPEKHGSLAKRGGCGFGEGHPGTTARHPLVCLAATAGRLAERAL